MGTSLCAVVGFAVIVFAWRVWRAPKLPPTSVESSSSKQLLVITPIVIPEASWRPAPPPWSELPWSRRTILRARTIHELRLAERIRAHSCGERVCIDHTVDEFGRTQYRAWINAPSFETSGAWRGTWSTRAGAMRILLNVIVRNGGAWHDPATMSARATVVREATLLGPGGESNDSKPVTPQTAALLERGGELPST